MYLESYLQVAVEGIGIDESIRGKDRKQGEGRAGEKVGDNRNLCIEAITEQAVCIYPPKSDCFQSVGKYPLSCTKSLW